MSTGQSLLVLAFCLVGGYVVQALGIAVAIVALRRRDHPSFARSVARLRGPARIAVPFAFAAGALTKIRLTPLWHGWLTHTTVTVLVLSFAWLASRVVTTAEQAFLRRFQLDNTAESTDPDRAGKAQRVHTQVTLLKRLAQAAIVVIAAGMLLMSFSQGRIYGASLLASAGIAGVVVGLAAQPIMTNLLAGAQIGIAQPFRINDVVVIDGHWGRIEEVSLTYVVVRIWDLRRLVIPVSWFVKNPFENWTRSGAGLLSFAQLEVDYRAPIAAMRDELHRILEQSSDWSGEVWNLQVTGSGPSTLQVRALMSAKDSSSGWNLQCEVYEKLVGFLQENHPYALPRIRLESRDPGQGLGPGANGDLKRSARAESGMLPGDN